MTLMYDCLLFSSRPSSKPPLRFQYACNAACAANNETKHRSHAVQILKTKNKRNINFLHKHDGLPNRKTLLVVT